MSFSRGNSEVRDLLEKEKDDLKRKLDDQRKKSVILAEQLAQNTAEDVKGRDELNLMREAMMNSKEDLVLIVLSQIFS